MICNIRLWLVLLSCFCMPQIWGRCPSLQLKSLQMVYRTEDSFKGFFEALNGQERSGGRIFVRSNKDCRGGIYFVLDFNLALQCLPKESVCVIEYITTDSPHVQTFQWNLPAFKGVWRNEMYLGITGEQLDFQLVSWHVYIRDLQGRIITELKSFAWN